MHVERIECKKRITNGNQYQKNNIDYLLFYLRAASTLLSFFAT